MDPYIVEHVRFLNCCTNYKPFARLPKPLQHIGINIILEKIKEKSFCNIKNAINWDHFHNLAFTMKINLDVESSINATSKNDHLIRGLTNYILFAYFVSIGAMTCKDFKFLKKQSNMISPHDIFNINPQTFNMPNNKKYIDNIKKRTEEKIEHKTTRMHFCVKCQNRKTRVQEMQLRCGDEGATTFIECVVCGHRWKKGV